MEVQTRLTRAIAQSNVLELDEKTRSYGHLCSRYSDQSYLNYKFAETGNDPLNDEWHCSYPLPNFY